MTEYLQYLVNLLQEIIFSFGYFMIPLIVTEMIVTFISGLVLSFRKRV